MINIINKYIGQKSNVYYITNNWNAVQNELDAK